MKNNKSEQPMNPMLLQDLGMREISSTDNQLRRMGKYLCTQCHLNTYVARVDSDRKRCDDCIAQCQKDRRVVPDPEVMYGKLKFLEELPTEPPKYRNYAKFACACGNVIKAEVRLVLNGQKTQCSRSCTG